jgi:hypothetical protein
MVVTVFGPLSNDEMRDKAYKVIQKLCQIKVLTNLSVIEWAVAKHNFEDEFIVQAL